MSEARRERLREAFDEDAELYDRVRPGYPSALFADLAARASIGPGSRVLEIGCGTGQAKLPLARYGAPITGLDLGEGMAAVARRKLAQYPNVSVLVAPFETWRLPAQPFDTIISATAFHWLDPAVRVSRVAAALHPGGTLATIWTHHVRGGEEAFFEDAQRCYERWDPETPPGGIRLPDASEIPNDTAEIDSSGLFGPVSFLRYEWEQTYSTDGYLDLLMTYSGHRTLEPERRKGLLHCIASLIDSRFGGSVRKAYLTELRLATRR